jgi:hypothetical protein
MKSQATLRPSPTASDWRGIRLFKVYCSGDQCDLAKLLANKLLSEGFSNLLLFRGGWDEWVRSLDKPM